MLNEINILYHMVGKEEQQATPSSPQEPEEEEVHDKGRRRWRKG